MTETLSCLLPDTVIPEKYRLHLQPNLDEFTTKGWEVIALDVKKPTKEIILHAAEDITIRSVALLQGWQEAQLKEIIRDSVQQRATLVFHQELTPGPAKLLIDFTSTLNDQLCGFYRSTYEVAGEKRIMAATQFEAIDARRAFPCWDEPARKAIFEVSLVFPQHLSAISNMLPTQERMVGFGLKNIHFAPTPPMSTYLLAMLVGEFEGIEDTTKTGIKIRVLTTPGKSELGRYALEEAIRVLESLHEYFDEPYPLSKLDLVALPDFGAGAMENWGCITFRESVLLVDPKNSSEATKERVSEVVAHEIAHQWFGNLVTMSWWDGLWLNEGFASWMELKTNQMIHPEWQAENKFAAEDFVGALHADALRNSRPVHVSIHHPDEINETFDAITYAKGASIIRMLENFLGEEVFRNGLRRYIKKHAYGNAEPEHLWDALEEESGKPVRTMMKKWVYQKGYPLLRAKRNRINTKTVLEITQEPFTFEKAGEDTPTVWNIPVGSKSRMQKDTNFFILEKTKTIVDVSRKTGDTMPEEWLKLNAAHTGFFRVCYEPSDLLCFRPAIVWKELAVADRLEICDDAYALTRAGEYPADLFFELMHAYWNEDNLRVWSVLLSAVHHIAFLSAGESYFPKLQTSIRRLLSHRVSALGWEEKEKETRETKMLRGMLLRAAGVAKDWKIVEEAWKRFEIARIDTEKINPNIRSAVYHTVAATGDNSLYENMVALYQKATLPEEKLRFLGALTSFEEPKILEKTLDFLFSGEVRSQDIFLMLHGLSQNPSGRDITWQFIKIHWDKIEELYAGGKLIGRVISAVCDPLISFAHESDVRSFFEAHPVPAAKRTIQQALEKIRVNARWLERNRPILAGYFKTA